MYVYSEIDDVTALTPSHFLCGKRLTALPDIKKKLEKDPDFVAVKRKDLIQNIDKRHQVSGKH